MNPLQSQQWVLARCIDRLWYDRKSSLRVLLPLSWCFQGVVALRRWLYACDYKRAHRLKKPVIVVGNLTVGGTGKTPLVIWIANFLQQAGYRPGIISRGYGGKARHWPQQVRADSDPRVVGDEALLIARHTGCPMAVGPDRVRAGQELLVSKSCDVLISDDGLQHYRLGRDIEIAVVDGVRRFGNGCCLPAGPLREPASRLSAVDLVVCNGVAYSDEFGMRLEGDRAVAVTDESRVRPLSQFTGQSVHAVAGIGNPRRFFDYLRRFRLVFDSRIFPDHHRYNEADIRFDDGLPVLMTEKDAVKCQRIATEMHWYVPVKAQLDDAFGERLLQLLQEI